ncbi:hypothetical protein [Streptomyces sp. NPDC056160]|uniref:hypothetical protein n=1 Tax=Streptomyces sp. NPDC056160 TaxID=3345731 RepID=UPI0035D77CCC
MKFTVHTPNGTFVTLGATEVATRARVAGSTARRHAATVNGRPGVISWSADGTPPSVLAFAVAVAVAVADGNITEITAVVGPAELAPVDLPDPVWPPAGEDRAHSKWSTPDAAFSCIQTDGNNSISIPTSAEFPPRSAQ